jgi:hypothetical protein
LVDDGRGATRRVSLAGVPTLWFFFPGGCTQHLFPIPDLGEYPLVTFVFEALSPRHLFPAMVWDLFAGIFRSGSLP